MCARFGIELTLYINVDYADESNDRRSVSGTAVTLEGAAVSWACSTQRCVMLSTTEEYYVALGEGVKEALFTRVVLSSIYPELSGSRVRFFEDSQGAIALAETPLSSGRSKHIHVRFDYVRATWCEEYQYPVCSFGRAAHGHFDEIPCCAAL